MTQINTCNSIQEEYCNGYIAALTSLRNSYTHRICTIIVKQHNHKIHLQYSLKHVVYSHVTRFADLYT